MAATTPLLFGLFLAVLVGVAIWHERALAIAGVGLGVILAVRLALTPFSLGDHLLREWAKLANLFGLLVGFELLADHFERSAVTDRLARRLPDGALGGFALLAVALFALSGYWITSSHLADWHRQIEDLDHPKPRHVGRYER